MITEAHELEPMGPTRRAVLQRAALLAGTTAWAAPTVQVLTMGAADAASHDGEEPPVCTPASPSSFAEARTADLRVMAVQTSSPFGDAEQSGPGSDAGSGGAGRFEASPGGSGFVANTVSAVANASVLDAPGPDDARSSAVSTVEDFVLTLPALVALPTGGTLATSVTITATVLTSTATAKVTSDGEPSLTQSSSVGSVRVQAPALAFDQTVSGPGPGERNIGDLVVLTFGAIGVPLGRPGVATTITALRLRTLQTRLPLPEVELAVAKSTAQADFPVCPPQT